MFSKPHESNQHCHIQALHVSPQFVRAEFLFVSYIKVKAAGYRMGDLFEMVGLLQCVNETGESISRL